MKAIILTILISLFALAARAQDTNAPRTELDAFEARIGVVIVHGSLDIGTVTTAEGTVTVKCKESSDTHSGQKQLGMSVTLTAKNQTTDTTVIDYDELDSLLSSIDYLATANWSVTSLPNFDATYTTRDGLRAAAFSSQRRYGTVGASLLSCRLARVRIGMPIDQFLQFRGLVQQAKLKLDGLRAGK